MIGAAGIFWEVGEERDPPPPAERVQNGSPRSRHEVEVILLRRLAERLTMPIFVIDVEGRLLFYNQPAEPILGRRFDELGPVELVEWHDAFRTAEENGSPIKREDHPLVVALRKGQPSFRSFQIQGLDGFRRSVEGTAFPLLGQCDRHLGAVGIFWEGAP